MSDKNVELLKKTYAEIAATLSVDQQGLAQTGNHLVLAPTGGIFIDDSLSFDDDMDRAAIINNLVTTQPAAKRLDRLNG